MLKEAGALETKDLSLPLISHFLEPVSSSVKWVLMGLSVRGCRVSTWDTALRKRKIGIIHGEGEAGIWGHTG